MVRRSVSYDDPPGGHPSEKEDVLNQSMSFDETKRTDFDETKRYLLVSSASSTNERFCDDGRGFEINLVEGKSLVRPAATLGDGDDGNDDAFASLCLDDTPMGPVTVANARSAFRGSGGVRAPPSSTSNISPTFSDVTADSFDLGLGRPFAIASSCLCGDSEFVDDGNSFGRLPTTNRVISPCTIDSMIYDPDGTDAKEAMGTARKALTGEGASSTHLHSNMFDDSGSHQLASHMLDVGSDPRRRPATPSPPPRSSKAASDRAMEGVPGRHSQIIESGVDGAAPALDTQSLLSSNSMSSPKSLPDSEIAMVQSVLSSDTYTAMEEAYSKVSSKLGQNSSLKVTRTNVLDVMDGVEKSPAARIQIHPLSQRGADSETGTAKLPILHYGNGSDRGRSTSPKQGRVVLQDRLALSPKSNCSSSDVATGNDEVLGAINDIEAKSPIREPHDHAQMMNDCRMETWMNRLTNTERNGAEESKGCDDADMYILCESRSLIVHEIKRGDWTWCVAWSPDGDRLAIATENHHLAILETSSSIWKVVHDRRTTGQTKQIGVGCIRSIAWGAKYIAIGGTGDSVSIILPTGDYPIVHVLEDTGYVGSLHWRADSSTLAIGSRDDQCSVVDIGTGEDDDYSEEQGQRIVMSNVLLTVDVGDWVNAVAFKPDGSILAIGDRSGRLCVHLFRAMPSSTSRIKDIQMESSILDLAWSADGKWLFSGGEDFAVTVIDASSWEIVHKVKQKRWCPCLAPSHGGQYVAVGGATSGVTLLDASNGWKPLKFFETGSILALSLAWHPNDHFLTIAGQSNAMTVVETTDHRHVKGTCLRSKASITSVAFSPDGKILAVGNASGVFSFFDTSKSELETVYEVVCCHNGANAICWSLNGMLVAVGGGDTVLVISTAQAQRKRRSLRSSSGFSLNKVIRGFNRVASICFCPRGNLMAISGPTAMIFDTTSDYARVREMREEITLASSWSPDGTLFAMLGNLNLTIYDTGKDHVKDWAVLFTFQVENSASTLAWGPSVKNGLQYLAYGGRDRKVKVLEIRTKEVTWETAIIVPRFARIRDLAWHSSGVLAAACSDGSTVLIDLAYLQSGNAVNKMDCNWQRQGLTCFTEILRQEKGNAITSLSWMPSNGCKYMCLSLGGTDGTVEIIDMGDARHKNPVR